MNRIEIDQDKSALRSLFEVFRDKNVGDEYFRTTIHNEEGDSPQEQTIVLLEDETTVKITTSEDGNWDEFEITRRQMMDQIEQILGSPEAQLYFMMGMDIMQDMGFSKEEDSVTMLAWVAEEMGRSFEEELRGESE